MHYKEDILVGYRWLDTKMIEPLFPFGYGLSYTTFAYSKPSVNSSNVNADDTVKVMFTLTNTGKKANKPGKWNPEVTQFYWVAHHAI